MVSSSNTSKPNAPCPCGSGKKYKKCCGSQAQSSVRDLEHSTPELLALLLPGLKALREGRGAEAKTIVDQCTIQFPGNGSVSAFFRICMYSARNQRKQIPTLLDELAQDYQASPELLVEISNYYLSLGLAQSAEALLLQALQINTDYSPALIALARLLDRIGLVEDADYYFRRALFHAPDDALLLTDMAHTCSKLAWHEDSEYFFRRAVAINPSSSRPYYAWANMEESRNQLERAQEILDKVKTLVPSQSQGKLLQGRISRRLGDFTGALNELEQVNHSSLNPPSQSSYHYDLGLTYERLGRFDEAFSSFSEACRIQRTQMGMKYDAALVRKSYEETKTFFSNLDQSVFSAATPAQDKYKAPVFIVGFPRSGTTLVEQILSAHSNIEAGDELHLLARLPEVIGRGMNSGQAVRTLLDNDGTLHQSDLQPLHDFYIKKCQQKGFMEPGVKWFTDKTPLNEMELGLGALLFPQSPIIHLIRHPLDVVLSCFFTDVRHGSHFATDLKSAAYHYVLSMEMTDLYLESLDLNYLSVRYEDIVDGLGSQVKSLLDFVGEPWEDACLDFQSNKRKAKTASYSQVTEPLYTRSVYRYKNYRSHLDDVIPILQPYIDRFGYVVEDC
jgi:tetratricopeptide (TPR) repeat protein